MADRNKPERVNGPRLIFFAPVQPDLFVRFTTPVVVLRSPQLQPERRIVRVRRRLRRRRLPTK